MTKVEELKQLKELLDQNLINQDEFDKLRAEILTSMPPPLPPRGSTGRPFSVPPTPLSDQTILRNPVTGARIMLEKWPTFGLTLVFGCFYLAYREAWFHAAVALVLGLFTYGLSWLIYPFFAYGIIVDSYRRKGWIVETAPFAGPPPRMINPIEEWLQKREGKLK